MTEKLVKVYVHSVITDVNYNEPVVILREVNGTRVLPIWIGPMEAAAISLALNNEMTARPLTHETLYRIVRGLGGEVEKVAITKLEHNVFFGRLVIKRGEDEIVTVDIRPSDAIAIALLANAPIFVADDVMTKGQLE